ncbi:hypothetical protein N7481_002948 [Penicillium waksmanii]|uniref:uncharacterized protein n=1 Tax=Penicillium waksmanii TaxID=69791 RepID=UPI0025497C00|nr:uncharacterized protein N7481_002948 [Penicillium waksmanii]KAJ5987738.1 hypothetical protein N7481_002948 [Penicillium waksmanii]
MKKPILFLLAAQCVPVFCQPYNHPPSDLAPSLETINSISASESCAEVTQVLEIRDHEDDEKARLFARATTETTDSTTSTTESTTTSTTSTSETTTASTSSTTSTTTSDSTTTSSTTSTSTSSTSISSTSTSTSTTSTTTSTSSSTTTTTSTASTTTSTATSTSTTSAEVKEWNRKGNIAAVAFSVSLISLFLGISIVHCARDRAKSKRIAARELLKASATSAEPLSHTKTNSTANLLPDSSSVMLKDNPFSDSRPRTAQDPSPTPNNNSQAGVGGTEARENVVAPAVNHQQESLV